MPDKEQFTDELRDYSLVGQEARLSIEKGLADASWYTSPVPREKMRELLVRKNGPAIRDTLHGFSPIHCLAMEPYQASQRYACPWTRSGNCCTTPPRY